MIMQEQDKQKYIDKIKEYLKINHITTIREISNYLDISYYKTERLLNELVGNNKIKKKLIKESKIAIFYEINELQNIGRMLEKERELLQQGEKK